MQVGAIEVDVVSDGTFFSDPNIPFANAVPSVLAQLLADRVDVHGRLRVPRNCLLLRDGAHVLLVDAGAGPYASGKVGLADSLHSIGVSHDDIDVVLISHAHPDHIGGLTTAGVPAFPRAQHYLSAAEHQFWLTDASEHFPDFFTGPPREQIPPLARAGQLELLDGEHELLPGVRAEPAYGHTPGHMIVSIESRGERMLFVADALLDELNVQYPECFGAMDVLPDTMVATRRRLLERAAREHSLLIGFHLERPGHVEKSGGAFRFVAASPAG